MRGRRLMLLATLLASWQFTGATTDGVDVAMIASLRDLLLASSCPRSSSVHGHDVPSAVSGNTYVDTQEVTKDLKRRSIRSGLGMFGAQLAKLALGIVSMAILARLLSPEDFGLVAMATSALGFLRFSGAEACLQRLSNARH